MTLQALRFPKDVWDKSKAQDWIDKHKDGIKSALVMSTKDIETAQNIGEEAPAVEDTAPTHSDAPNSENSEVVEADKETIASLEKERDELKALYEQEQKKCQELIEEVKAKDTEIAKLSEERQEVEKKLLSVEVKT